MDKYDMVRRIGAGSCGSVYLVREKAKGNAPWIVKKISLTTIDPGIEAAGAEAQGEVRALEKLRHTNIVHLKESFLTDDYLCIVMEYCEGGDLFNRIRTQRKGGTYFDETQILDWFVQLCLALQHCHTNTMLHRDLKTQNVFLKGDIVRVRDVHSPCSDLFA